MIRGYVSSDEDDYDDYDFGYFEGSAVKKRESPTPIEIQIPENREKLNAALKESEKIDLFFKNVELGNITALEELISEGVSVDCQNDQKWTPLINACSSGNVELVQFLLENGAKPNKHRELLTPLMTCCTYTMVAEDLKLTCVRLLLEYGADVNAKDKYHTTALMYATESGYADIVTQLLEVPGIDVNVQDKEGWTALFYAVKNNNKNLVERLVSSGTNLNLEDRLGRTVISLALHNNLTHIATILGYVEKKCHKTRKVKTLKKKFLSKLPDSNGQGGFSSDAKSILKAFNQFNLKPISLPDLLNATDKDLYEIGVVLKPDREKVLSKGIHKYHLHPWKNSSLPKINPRVPLSIEDTIAIVGDLAKHLTIANATLRYLDTRISLRQKEELINLAVEKETIICLIDIYQSAEKLKTMIPEILEQVKQIKPFMPADYIYPYKQEKKNKRGKFFRILLYGLAAAAAVAIATHRRL